MSGVCEATTDAAVMTAPPLWAMKAGLTYTPIGDIPHHINGRHDPRPQFANRLYWTASGVELAYTGGELWLCIETWYTQFEPWVSIDVDGVRSTRTELHPGMNVIPVFRGMGDGGYKRVRLLKETQFMHEDPTQTFAVAGVLHDGGTFARPARHRFRLEFVGDSITSGQGVAAASSCRTYCSGIFGAWDAYPRLVADELDAGFEVVSQSGWGVTCNCENDPTCTIPAAYPYICAPARGKVNLEAGSDGPLTMVTEAEDSDDGRDFDAVIINLGTNDATAFHAPAWHDPVTGRMFKLRLDDAGMPQEDDLTLIRDAAVRFIIDIRAHHPRAWIVWCYGMLGHVLEPTLREAVVMASHIHHDDRLLYVTLPECGPDGYGATLHPGPANHRAAADVILRALRQRLV